MNSKYQQKKPVSAIDVDIFVNSLKSPESELELKYIIKKFRQTPKTVDTLDSTHHAFCRYYINNEKLDELMEILNNRVEFGIFPDVYTYNILLDKCIKEEKWDHCFNIVKLMMLQEDSGNEITKTLSLFVLNRLLSDGKFGPKEPVEMASEDNSEKDEDIEYIRVPFLRNYYFDDHFDLTNRDHIFGKCWYFFARELEKSSSHDDDDILANTGMIIGLVFYQKWEQLNNLISRLSSNKKFKILSELEELIKNHIELFKNVSAHEELLKVKSRLEECTESITSVSLSKLIDKRIVNLPKNETIDKEQMVQMFEQFQQNRIKKLNEQMERLYQEQLQKEIEENKLEYEKKKRLYYFFENFSKHEIDFVEAEKQINEIRSKTVVEEDYVPPERY